MYRAVFGTLEKHGSKIQFVRLGIKAKKFKMDSFPANEISADNKFLSSTI
jgi:hypothetical protein